MVRRSLCKIIRNDIITSNVSLLAGRSFGFDVIFSTAVVGMVASPQLRFFTRFMGFPSAFKWRAINLCIAGESYSFPKQLKQAFNNLFDEAATKLYWLLPVLESSIKPPASFTKTMPVAMSQRYTLRAMTASYLPADK